MSDLRAPQPPSFDSSALAASSDSGKRKKAEMKVDLQNLPDLLTISEVSTLLRVSPLTIKRWGKRGKLPAIRINSRGDRRYKKQAVLWMLGMTESSTVV